VPLRELLDAAHNLPLLHISVKIQAILSILGVGSRACLTSYNSGIIYLTCKRICRRNMTDSKTADCKAFFTAAILDMPHENISSKTKEVLTLTSVKLERFLLNHKPLCLSYIYISLPMTHKSTKPERHCSTTAI